MKRYRPKLLVERRKYIRLGTPVGVSYNLLGSTQVYTTISKNISADGFAIQTQSESIKEDDPIELKLSIPGAINPVHAKGKVIWKRRLSLEDNAPFDVGIEFTDIEEDNKNTFLKFLCDIIYNIPKEPKDET